MHGATVTLLACAQAHPAITVEDADRQRALEHGELHEDIGVAALAAGMGRLRPPSLAPVMLLPTRYDY